MTTVLICDYPALRRERKRAKLFGLAPFLSPVERGQSHMDKKRRLDAADTYSRRLPRACPEDLQSPEGPAPPRMEMPTDPRDNPEEDGVERFDANLHVRMRLPCP
jgi:hypothetical protein